MGEDRRHATSTFPSETPPAPPSRATIVGFVIVLWILWVAYAGVSELGSMFCYDQGVQGAAACQRRATAGIAPSFVLAGLATAAATRKRLGIAFVLAVLAVIAAVALPR